MISCCWLLSYVVLPAVAAVHKSWALLRLYCQFRSQVAVLWNDGVDFAVGEVDESTGRAQKWHKASPLSCVIVLHPS